MAVDFDGSTDYLTRAKLQGLSDGKTGTVSVWVKPDAAGDASSMWILHCGDSQQKLLLSRTSLDRFLVTGRNAANTVRLLLQSTAALSFTGGTWYHVMASWDLANGLGKLYINGTDRTDPTQVLTDDSVALANQKWNIGADQDEGNLWNGIIDEVYFDDFYIDLTESANRRLFYGQGSSGGGTTSGSQVGLGHQGRRPTGRRPKLLLTHGPGNFGRNEGSGGDFTIVGSPTFGRGRPAANNTLSRGFKGQRWRESERSGIPFPEERLVFEPASGLEVARREYSTDRDEINRRKRFGHSIFEF
jgi:hypothetical protein